jgi:Ca2+:H+ antiporter
LILLPLVEKAAEHITAVNEAWENNMNNALAHILGSSVQTALLNTPLTVLIGWGLHIKMDLKFQTFDAAVLVLAIFVVGNFLRTGKSNWLAGLLCILVYMVRMIPRINRVNL